MSGIASYHAESGDAGVAARLLGWVDEQGSRLGSPRDADVVALEERLGADLGRERFASEVAAGAALGRQDAIALALGVTEPPREPGG